MPSEDSFLLPGEMAYLRDGGILSTLLGSCVAVRLHDHRRTWGGLNHYMVPEQTGQLAPGKVGTHAIDGLIRMATMAGSSLAPFVLLAHEGLLSSAKSFRKSCPGKLSLHQSCATSTNGACDELIWVRA